MPLNNFLFLFIKIFTAYTSGSMAGRITGDKGDYDPANNL